MVTGRLAHASNMLLGLRRGWPVISMRSTCRASVVSTISAALAEDTVGSPIQQGVSPHIDHLTRSSRGPRKNQPQTTTSCSASSSIDGRAARSSSSAIRATWGAK